MVILLMISSLSIVTEIVCLLASFLTLWQKMKGLCCIISENIYSELAVREELGWISCSDGPDLSRIGINVICMIHFSYSGKCMQKKA